jgi:hypothetical protein
LRTRAHGDRRQIRATENGKLAQREYHDRDGKLLNREALDAEGFIAESIRYGDDSGKPFEAVHWWFERGTPVKQVSKEGAFAKQSDQWIATKQNERAEKKRCNR